MANIDMALSSEDTTSAMGGVSWAEAVEDAERLGSNAQEAVVNGIKTRTETTFNELGDKIRITSTFRIEKKRVPKPVAERKKLKKFGAAENDPPGPNSANTYPSEEINIDFIRNRAGELETGGMGDSDPFNKLKSTGAGMHCRFCKQKDHFSITCPYKDQLSDLQEDGGEGGSAPETDTQRQVREGKYVPPGLRGAAVRGVGTTMDRGRDENTVRVTNLPEDTTDQDLRDLFGNCGRVNRIFLAKDKTTGNSKGFAFVTYERREDAEKAITAVSGHRYGYVILKVEWARQST